jgi:hypothetical protein
VLWLCWRVLMLLMRCTAGSSSTEWTTSILELVMIDAILSLMPKADASATAPCHGAVLLPGCSI